MAFCIDDSRYDIDKRHQYRKDINGEVSDKEGGIFFAEISYEAELHPLKALHP